MVRKIDDMRKSGPHGIEVLVNGVWYWVQFAGNETADELKARIKLKVDESTDFDTIALNNMKSALSGLDLDK